MENAFHPPVKEISTIADMKKWQDSEVYFYFLSLSAQPYVKH